MVRGLADHYGLQMLEICSDDDDDWDLQAARWMVLSRNREFLAAMSAYAQPEPVDASRLLWTDGYSNLFEILKVE